jgi:hypothetical protein
VYYKVVTVLKVKEGEGREVISYVIRHLKNKHNINIKHNKASVPILRPSIFGAVADLARSTLASVVTKGYKALVSIIDVERFQRALIMFFVIYNIIFSVIKSFYYKELLFIYLANILEPFLLSAANTLKRWILEEFKKKKLDIKNEIIITRSRIYISFDL